MPELKMMQQEKWLIIFYFVQNQIQQKVPASITQALIIDTWLHLIAFKILKFLNIVRIKING